MGKPLHITGAYHFNGDGFDQHDLFMRDHILAQRPHNALTVDLSGFTLYPGFINAHDHLELNHYPRTKFREKYDNAHQWGEDVNARLNDSPFRELRAYPLKDRLFIGGLKNLLCGALTVAHHNPPHRALFARDFPVRVLKRYGWAHSLHFSSHDEILKAYRQTPPDAPFFIHLAEGTDDIARVELQRLKALGIIGINERFTLVHGVGLAIDEICATAVNIVWCPTSNHYLLNATLPVKELLRQQCTTIFLGSDSRLTADGDLLDELRAALAHGIHIWDMLYSVTWRGAWLLNLPEVGGLAPEIPGTASGNVADFFAVRETAPSPDATMFKTLRRADLALIVRGGVPQIGDPDVMERFPHIKTVRATLDGHDKRINRSLARQIARCTLSEPGLQLLETP